MKDEIDFTPLELYMLSYLRNPAGGRRTRILVESGYMVASVVLVGLYLAGRDPFFGCLGYFLLIYRLGYFVLFGNRTTQTIASIVAKYEARIAALSTGDPDQPGGAA